MTTIYRYFLALIACASLLLGMQAPNLVDQYQKRLDAHLSEVTTDLRAFQEIADRFFGGSLEALIDKHERSTDAVFKAEAEPIRTMFDRQRRFSDEKRALDTGLPGKIAFIVARGDRQLLAETLASYSFSVPLNGAAVASGVAGMSIAVLLIELLRITAARIIGLRARPPQFSR